MKVTDIACLFKTCAKFLDDSCPHENDKNYICCTLEMCVEDAAGKYGDYRFCDDWMPSAKFLSGEKTGRPQK